MNSDKIISKWETGVSIPDTSLLVPLADLFGVTVTELLMSERMIQEAPLDANQVEAVVQTALSYTEDIHSL
ncbi:MAG: helix-turn-helix domain-containing protein [Lachnospiraceae bacterium]